MADRPAEAQPVWDADVAENAGYRYTTDAPLSSRLANARISRAILRTVDVRGRRVLDIGCGDGTYTVELAEAGAAAVVGLDPSAGAIEVARHRSGPAPVEFGVGSAYELPYTDAEWDVAQLRGVLHHLDDPVAALREALRVARVVVAMEPNGYNPGLKVLERVSPYHVEHDERSFMPRTIHRWLHDLGARVVSREFIGLVPMFSPDWLARSLKRLEPLLEHTPVLRAVGCAQYIFAATQEDASRA